ncbi:hypothetical protein DVA76_17650, partial [Acinetobacter baumannii]
TQFVICGDVLYKKTYNQLLLRCVDESEAETIMIELYEGICSAHVNGLMLAEKILRMGYFWITMESDCCKHVKRCHKCQIHANEIHIPSSQLYPLTSPWPFAMWGIDIIGKIHPKASNGHQFILVAIDNFTKWVEAASFVSVTASQTVRFLKNHIVCRF